MNDHFSWNRNGLDEARFAALTNLLALRNGGQMEVPAVYDGDDDVEAINEIDHMSACDTEKPELLPESTDTLQQLKEQFLDKFSEVVSTRKGGLHVACAAMKETTPSSVSIIAARNGGFGTEDDAFFRETERFLSKEPNLRTLDSDLDGEFWNTLLEYYDLRLRETYIPDLAKCFTDRAELFSTELSFRDDLESLRLFCLWRGDGASFTLENISLLVQKAFAVRKSTITRDYLIQSGANKLWHAICFVARLRTAYFTFLKAREKLVNFGQVTIVSISVPKRIKRPQPLDLSETLHLLGLTLDKKTLQRHLRSKPNVAKMENEFMNLEQRHPLIHAEVQIVLYLMRTEFVFTDAIPYIGCSKRSCFLCWSFLQALPKTFRTRGCHGKVYGRWSVPATTKLSSTSVQAIVDALLSVQTRVGNQLRLPILLPTQHVAESTVGPESVIEGEVFEPRLGALRNYQERQHIARYPAQLHRLRQGNASVEFGDSVDPPIDSLVRGWVNHQSSLSSSSDTTSPLDVPVYNPPRRPKQMISLGMSRVDMSLRESRWLQYYNDDLGLSELDLSKYIGNKNGELCWDSSDFHSSVVNARLVNGHTLVAKMHRTDGKGLKNSSLDLDMRIHCDEEALEYDVDREKYLKHVKLPWSTPAPVSLDILDDREGDVDKPAGGSGTMVSTTVAAVLMVAFVILHRYIISIVPWPVTNPPIAFREPAEMWKKAVKKRGKN